MRNFNHSIFFVTESQSSDDVSLAIMAGVTIVQVETSGIIAGESLLEIKKACNEFKVPLIIGGSFEEALKISADGVCLNDIEMISKARILEPEMIIGAHVSNLADALKAESCGTDFLLVSRSSSNISEITQKLKVPVIICATSLKKNYLDNKLQTDGIYISSNTITGNICNTIKKIKETFLKNNRKIIKDKKLVMFDFDGTLFDSMKLWGDIDKKFLSKRGIFPPEDYMHAVSALGFRETAVYTINRFNFKDSPEELMDEFNSLAQDAYATQISLLPNVREYLKELKDSGMRIVGVTSSHRNHAIPCLKNNGIVDFFERVFTVDDMEYSKTSIMFFKTVMDQLKVNPDNCVLFDDVPKVIETASLCGITTVGVYENRSKHSRKDFANANHFIKSLALAPIIVN